MRSLISNLYKVRDIPAGDDHQLLVGDGKDGMGTASGSPHGVEATQSAINQGAHALSVSYRRDAAYLKPSVFKHLRGSGDA